MNAWECPKCGKVYAPFVGDCFSCNSKIDKEASDREHERQLAAKAEAESIIERMKKVNSITNALLTAPELANGANEHQLAQKAVEAKPAKP